MFKKLFLLIIISFCSFAFHNEKAYAQETDMSSVLDEYNTSDYVVLNTRPDMVNYIYNSFLNYKGAVIEYEGEEYNSLTLDDVTGLLYSAMQIDDKSNINDCESLWGNMKSYNRGIEIKDGYALICLSLNYKHTKAEMDQLNLYIYHVVNNLNHEYNLESLSDMEKSKIIHDYIVNNFDYDETYTNYTDYDAVFNRIDGKNIMVCQGYSLLYYKMLQTLGVNCKIIVSDEHSWNLVQINGTWYHVDVTNDDNGVYGDNQISYKYFMKEALSGKIYQYLNTYVFYNSLANFNLSNSHLPGSNASNNAGMILLVKLLINIAVYLIIINCFVKIVKVFVNRINQNKNYNYSFSY